MKAEVPNASPVRGSGMSSHSPVPLSSTEQKINSRLGRVFVHAAKGLRPGPKGARASISTTGLGQGDPEAGKNETFSKGVLWS